MTITWRTRTNGRTYIEEDIESVEFGTELFHQKGYGITRTDGTFSLYNFDTWEIVKIEQ